MLHTLEACKKKVLLLYQTVSHHPLLKAGAQHRNQRMSSGESNSYFPIPQSRVVHATILYADPPTDAHKAICFLGSGIAKDSHLLEQKKYCSILALILKKCLYRQESKPSASPHPGVICEHQHVPSHSLCHHEASHQAKLWEKSAGSPLS